MATTAFMRDGAAAPANERVGRRRGGPLMGPHAGRAVLVCMVGV